MSFSMLWDFGMSSQDMTEMIMWPLTLKTSLEVAQYIFTIIILFLTLIVF